MSLRDHLPDGKIVGKPRAAWVNRETESPVLVISDAQHYVMVSCGDADHYPTPWREALGSEWVLGSARESFSPIRDGQDDRDLSGLIADDTSTLDDTFSFKHT